MDANLFVPNQLKRQQSSFLNPAINQGGSNLIRSLSNSNSNSKFLSMAALPSIEIPSKQKPDPDDDDEIDEKDLSVLEFNSKNRVSAAVGHLAIETGFGLHRAGSLSVSKGNGSSWRLNGAEDAALLSPTVGDSPQKLNRVFNVEGEGKERDQQIKMQVLAILQQQLNLQMSKNKKGNKKGEKGGTDVPMPGGNQVPLLKSIVKGGKAAKNALGELQIDELDEKVLRSRLDALDKELASYKSQCAQYKKENEWYREEIESCKRDTADYIKYLELKKNEKEATINELEDRNKNEMDNFIQRKKKKEQENRLKIEELKNIATDLELKLSAKQQELMQMSDIVGKRAKHQSEIARLRQELHDIESAHQIKVSELERTLLEARIKLQREADVKIHTMESAAQERASKFLEEQTKLLESENKRLELELHNIIKDTQDLLSRKDSLEQQNKELLREQKVREDMVKLRLEKIKQAQNREAAKRKAEKKYDTSKQNENDEWIDEDEEYI
ncbi:hypothetical protein HK098_005718 [Nowakowskiella sp. JEL0407]|nr:hypothetical protein HK098_005718 [Nowakowskiella sp. JEL0407]